MQSNPRDTNPLGQYILQDRIPISCPDTLAWARWYKSADRIVAQHTIGRVLISTVFLGLDHNWSEKGPPLLFETAMREGDHKWMVMERYSTWERALEGHREYVSNQNRGI